MGWVLRFSRTGPPELVIHLRCGVMYIVVMLLVMLFKPRVTFVLVLWPVLKIAVPKQCQMKQKQGRNTNRPAKGGQQQELPIGPQKQIG